MAETFGVATTKCQLDGAGMDMMLSCDADNMSLEVEVPLLQHSGKLFKWTNMLHGWQERYFLLKKGILSYFKSINETNQECRGSVILCNASLRIHEYDNCRFEIGVGDTIWHLRSNSSEERQTWVDAITHHRLSTESGYGSSEQNLYRHNSLLSLNSVASVSIASASSYKRGNIFREKIAEMETFKEILSRQLDALQAYFDTCSRVVSNGVVADDSSSHASYMESEEGTPAATNTHEIGCSDTNIDSVSAMLHSSHSSPHIHSSSHSDHSRYHHHHHHHHHHAHHLLHHHAHHQNTQLRQQNQSCSVSSSSSSSSSSFFPSLKERIFNFRFLPFQRSSSAIAAPTTTPVEVSSLVVSSSASNAANPSSHTSHSSNSLLYPNYSAGNFVSINDQQQQQSIPFSYSSATTTPENLLLHPIQEYCAQCEAKEVHVSTENNKNNSNNSDINQGRNDDNDDCDDDAAIAGQHDNTMAMTNTSTLTPASSLSTAAAADFFSAATENQTNNNSNEDNDTNNNNTSNSINVSNNNNNTAAAAASFNNANGSTGNNRQEDINYVVMQHGSYALDFKGEAFTFKATATGILTDLSHCVELMQQQEDCWQKRFDREVERRRKAEELNRFFVNQQQKNVVTNQPIGAINKSNVQQQTQQQPQQLHHQQQEQLQQPPPYDRQVFSNMLENSATEMLINQNKRRRTISKRMFILGNPDMGEGPHCEIGEEEFFDAVDAQLDKLDEDEKKLEALKANLSKGAAATTLRNTKNNNTNNTGDNDDHDELEEEDDNGSAVVEADYPQNPQQQRNPNNQKHSSSSSSAAARAARKKLRGSSSSETGNAKQSSDGWANPNHPLCQETNRIIADQLEQMTPILNKESSSLSSSKSAALVDQVEEKSDWHCIAVDGEMRILRREVENAEGLAVDPLQIHHTIQGITAREICSYFWDAKYRLEWETTIDTAPHVVEYASEDTIVFHQVYKRVWPAAQRDALFWSTMREVSAANGWPAWLVVNRSTEYRAEELASLAASQSLVRIYITVAMLCQTYLDGRPWNPSSSASSSRIDRSRISCKLLYMSTINPGGWAPSSVLRTIARREYPRFIKRFSGYVTEKTRGQPIAF